MLIKLVIAVSLFFTVTGSPLLNHEEEDEPPEWLVENVEAWRRFVQPVVAGLSSPYLTESLVLAVIAQESQGINGLTSDDGYSSVGLMQVIPRADLGTPEQLMDPTYNLWTGTAMLRQAIEQAVEFGYDDPVRYGLAAYNCGWKMDPITNQIAFKLCNRHGGLAYADKVLDYWMPYFANGGPFVDCYWEEGDRGYWNRVCPLFSEDPLAECGDPMAWMDPRGRVQLQDDLENTSGWNCRMADRIRRPPISWYRQ